MCISSNSSYVAAPVVHLVLHGAGLTDDDVSICGRMIGRDLQLVVRKLPFSSAAGADKPTADCNGGHDSSTGTASRVAVLVSPARRGGLLILEPRRGRLLGQWWPVVVVPEGLVAGEINHLAEEVAAKAAPRGLLERDEATEAAAAAPMYGDVSDW